jgi:5-methylcytosine-specific restriction enzyme A
MIEEARNYLMERAINPVLGSDQASKGLLDNTRNTKVWLERFDRIGDLLIYIDRFRGASETEITRELDSLGLNTFEKIRPDFMQRFGGWASDRTRLDDFVIGRTYSSFQILIFAQRYNLLSGGILPIEHNGTLQAVLVRATMSGGAYDNQWLEEPQRLKYYLKSLNGDFRESYKDNAAIINNPSIPVCVFHRQHSGEDFEYAGAYKSVKVHHEEGGTKWFELEQASGAGPVTMAEESAFNQTFNESVERSKKSSRAERVARLAGARRKPRTVTVVRTEYMRNPDVVAEVLDRAAGVCEGCSNPAPFERSANGTPYLEVHHKVRLSEDGDDTVENALALCPNCHRQEHFGPRRWS